LLLAEDLRNDPCATRLHSATTPADHHPVASRGAERTDLYDSEKLLRDRPPLAKIGGVRSEAGQPSELVTEFGPGWGLPLGVRREAINMSFTAASI
jgi:hypothetical protein